MLKRGLLLMAFGVLSMVVDALVNGGISSCGGGFGFVLGILAAPLGAILSFLGCVTGLIREERDYRSRRGKGDKNARQLSSP
jgi:hypothetical protein